MDVCTGRRTGPGAWQAIDGVLLLQATHAAAPADRAEVLLASVTLAVTRHGEAVAGTLEVSGVDRTLAWRPAEPLVVPGLLLRRRSRRG